MRERIIFGLLLLPPAVFLLLQGGLLLRVALLGISLIALSELYRTLFAHSTPLNWLGYIGVLAYFTFLEVAISAFFVIFFGWVLLHLIYLVFHFDDLPIGDALSYAVLPIYTAVSLSTVFLIHEANAVLVWVVVLSAWGSDTCCYFVGKWLGKTKLTKLSPNKTVEGSVGGVMGASLFGLAFYQFFPQVLPVGANQAWIVYVLVFAVLAALSQLGDLVASAIKRQKGVKDFGALIPGHGGAMDRFDSILLTAPFFYAFVYILS